MLPADVSNSRVGASSDHLTEVVVPPRPYWAMVPPLLCLYLEDMVTLACAAATASTDDSELLELQEAGVMMLTEVARAFAQVMACGWDWDGIGAEWTWDGYEILMGLVWDWDGMVLQAASSKKKKKSLPRMPLAISSQRVNSWYHTDPSDKCKTKRMAWPFLFLRPRAVSRSESRIDQ